MMWDRGGEFSNPFGCNLLTVFILTLNPTNNPQDLSTGFSIILKVYSELQRHGYRVYTRFLIWVTLGQPYPPIVSAAKEFCCGTEAFIWCQEGGLEVALHSFLSKKSSEIFSN